MTNNLQEEIDRLRDKNRELNRRVQRSESAMAEVAKEKKKNGFSLGRSLANAEGMRLKLKCERLEKALNEYGSHDPNCDHPCTCGFNDALAILEEL